LKKLRVFLSCLLFFVYVSAAYSHPPSDIQIAFDPATRILNVVVVHSTSNPNNHYIEKVDVGLNGEEIIQQMISKEDNNQNQSVSYLIPNVKNGDKISVEGYCNISGKLKKEIIVDAVAYSY